MTETTLRRDDMHRMLAFARFTVCMMVLGPLGSHPVCAQGQDATATRASEGVEVGVHVTAVRLQSVTFLGPGARLTLPVRPRLAFEVGLDPDVGRKGLYVVQFRQTLARRESMKAFATYGMGSFSGVALPDFPTVGLGWQFEAAKYAALRVDGQLLFGVRSDATRGITRLSAGVAIPMRGYQRSEGRDLLTTAVRTTRRSFNSFAGSLATVPQVDPPRPPPTSVRPPPARVSKRKAALIGAAIGAGVGMAVGVGRCPECSSAERALVFAPVGAAIGAAAGLVLAVLPSP